jgi:type IV secretory pathway VirB2 component (pilin)
MTDPQGSGALVGAVNWLQGTLLGTAATTIAVIAVAGVGLMMLSGRIGAYEALRVVLGCFVLFGAPTIASGLRDLAAGTETPHVQQTQFVPVPPQAVLPAADYDPYAGASLRQD